MREMLPCPFCGTADPDDGDDHLDDCFLVLHARAETSFAVPDEELAAAWNRRADPGLLIIAERERVNDELLSDMQRMQRELETMRGEIVDRDRIIEAQKRDVHRLNLIIAKQ